MKQAVQHREITDEGQLREYCGRLSQAKTIAFDTEFVSEHTYRPVLCLIQVAADGELAVIDTISIADVTPFWEVVVAPGHETIVHAGRGELEFCMQAVDRWPERLFDVQIAAGLAGAEYPAGLSSLISRFLGQTPPKHETRTDWRRRPLSKRQIEYALNDVRFLQPLRDKICEKLFAAGRIEWLADEMDTWRKQLEHSTSQERWRRVSGNAGLDARTLAIVRELFHWRDGEAKRRDQPIRRVLRDDLIVELARRGSADAKQIAAVRGMERGDLQRRMSELAAAIQRGLDLPEAECPQRTAREQVPELSVLGQFLFAALGSISREAALAPNLVGTPNDIREWMVYRGSKSRQQHGNPPKLAHGWRAEFVGRLFDDLLDGKLSIRVDDPKSDHPLAFEPESR
jgi:ribonuclease D